MAGSKENQLSQKDLDKITEQLKEAKEFLDALEKIGADIPTPLTRSLDALVKALKTGKAVGEAAEEASDALEKYTKDLKAACKNIDDVQQMACEAGVERQWQARSVSFTLDPKNKKSVVSKLIDKAIKAYTPDIICKNWDRCAKIAK